MQHTQKHRHFIALPIAGIALAFVIGIHAFTPASVVRASRGADSAQVRGPSQSALSSGTHVSLDDGAVASVSEDGVSLRLEQGGALVSAQGYMELNVGCMRVQSLGGTFYVSSSDADLTVASVVGPVLVRLCSGTPRLFVDAMQIVIKPDGTEEVFSVDRSWIRKQQIRASDVQTPPVTNSHTSKVAMTILDRSVMLATLLRSTPVLDAHEFQSAQAMVDAIDADGFLRVLLAVTLVRSAPLSDAPTVQLLENALFSSSALDSDVTESIPRMLLSSTFALPESLHALWLDHALHSAVAQPLRMLSLIEEWSMLPALLDTNELPKQAALWRKNLMEIVRVLDPLLSSLERQTLPTIRSSLMLTSVISPEDSSPVLASVQTNARPAMPLDEMVLRTKQMLLQYGVLLTTDTRVESDQQDHQSVRVTGVFLSEDGKDTAYAFSYAPSSDVLHRIEREGVTLPNALTPEQFFRAMKKAP